MISRLSEKEGNVYWAAGAAAELGRFQVQLPKFKCTNKWNFEKKSPSNIAARRVVRIGKHLQFTEKHTGNTTFSFALLLMTCEVEEQRRICGLNASKKNRSIFGTKSII